MYKLWATIVKDFLILGRDKVGLSLMFFMPVALVVTMTVLQNSTFELVNERKINLLICNKDTGATAKHYVSALREMGMFQMDSLPSASSVDDILGTMQSKDALVALTIPADFSQKIGVKAEQVALKAMEDASIDTSLLAKPETSKLILHYNPVLEESFRKSISGALQNTLQLVEGRIVIQHLYTSTLDRPMPAGLEKDILAQSAQLDIIPATKDGSKKIPNATQHNIPAWTLFAMFFIVISLGGSVVREKQSGSFIRLKTLPTNYLTALVSKLITYLLVTMVQVAFIFSLGIWLFPHLSVPPLVLPSDLVGLALVSFISGACAVSYALCVGVLANTQEQANGFGAVSVVILSAIGGIMIPSFAMPSSFAFFLKLSPLHWALESYYDLFLENGKFADVLHNIAPLFAFILSFLGLTLYSLKRKNLI